MDAERCLFVVFALLTYALGLAIGCLLGDSVAEEKYQDAAVERGYAEWVKPEDPRAKPVWGWIEPAQEGDE